jgi:predicted nucleotidyltransferase
VRSALPTVAAQLGADERTLRRAATRGALRARRPTPRRLEFEPGELEYLRSHWELLQTLTAALRTEPNVGLAVLYGSAARGDDRAESDVDILVAFRDDTSGSAAALSHRLERAVGRPVDVARFSRVYGESPLLVLQAIDEGRVLVDRDGVWAEMRARRESVARAARRQTRRSRAEAAAALDQLTEGL